MPRRVLSNVLLCAVCCCVLQAPVAACGKPRLDGPLSRMWRGARRMARKCDGFVSDLVGQSTSEQEEVRSSELLIAELRETREMLETARRDLRSAKGTNSGSSMKAEVAAAKSRAKKAELRAVEAESSLKAALREMRRLRQRNQGLLAQMEAHSPSQQAELEDQVAALRAQLHARYFREADNERLVASIEKQRAQLAEIVESQRRQLELLEERLERRSRIGGRAVLKGAVLVLAGCGLSAVLQQLWRRRGRAAGAGGGVDSDDDGSDGGDDGGSDGGDDGGGDCGNGSDCANENDCAGDANVCRDGSDLASYSSTCNTVET
eukprot:TRINITY_DN9737_c0_g1_i1.p1 TRINITY_DN9737_c0_g1~~TRINITY_DN9737_c0_g1_i1.p1  ORF type:complete len:321 (+),score=98.21 TRINITY_DN9737_c0_g1_i1:75-1037(+)